MPGTSIVISMSDGITDALARTDAALRSRQLRAAMGQAIVDALKANFRKLNTERHRNEAGTQFYSDVAESVQRPQADTEQVVVAIGKRGFAQRLLGGTIVAGSNGSGAKWLTIPAIPAALGRRASSFGNLKFIFLRGKGQHGPGYGDGDLAALVSEDPKKASFSKGKNATKERGVALEPREDKRLPVVFWLKRSVTQKADPSVLPPEDELAATAYSRGAEYLEAVAGIEGGTAS